MFFKKNKNYFRKKKTACVLFGRQKFSRVNNKLDLSLCRPFPRQSLRLFSKQIRACVAHVFHKHPPRVRFFHSIIPGHLFFLLHSITFVFFTAPTFIFFTASLFFSQHHPRAQPRLRRSRGFCPRTILCKNRRRSLFCRKHASRRRGFVLQTDADFCAEMDDDGSILFLMRNGAQIEFLPSKRTERRKITTANCEPLKLPVANH